MILSWFPLPGWLCGGLVAYCFWQRKLFDRLKTLAWKEGLATGVVRDFSENHFEGVKVEDFLNSKFDDSVGFLRIQIPAEY